MTDASRDIAIQRHEDWAVQSLRAQVLGRWQGRTRTLSARPNRLWMLLDLPPGRGIYISPLAQPIERTIPMPEQNKPAHKIRGSAGSGLTLTLWKHDSDKGPWYTATPNRRYNQDGQWKDSNSYSQQDFLELAEMFREAHAWVKEQAKTRTADQGQEAEQGGYADRETGRKRAGGRQP
jgi:hypothetical protein